MSFSVPRNPSKYRGLTFKHQIYPWSTTNITFVNKISHSLGIPLYTEKVSKLKYGEYMAVLEVRVNDWG